MRTLAALSLVVLVVLAGCSFPFAGGDNATQTTTAAGDGGTAVANASSAGSATGASSTEPSTGGANATAGTTGGGAASLADPAHDVLGWEGGYWYNESLSVTPGNGLNASERSAMVNRTMARVEHIRGLEFTRTVPVKLVSREKYRSQTASANRTPGRAFQQFDNEKFEGLFLVGEDQNSLAVQRANRGSNVLGYYSPSENAIVIISDSKTPTIDTRTLSHELTHALQDQHLGLSSITADTRDAENAHNGLIEGDANYVEDAYEKDCNGTWSCLPKPASGGASTDSEFNYGVYFVSYFPYADGPGFVSYLRSHGGWDRVNAAYDDLPWSSEQIIHPPKYDHDEPTNLTVRDTNSNGWERVRPPNRPDYAVLGQSALSAMFGYTLYDDYNRSSVVDPDAFLNVEDGAINRSDPYDYALNYTDGWDGDRMAVYHDDNRTGYVWKLTWDSPADAREFVSGYERLLTQWGGERVLGRNGVWEVRHDSPFADAFSVKRDGATVTIVNAPRTGDLDSVHANATG